MSSEYIKIGNQEVNFNQRTILEGQLNILSTIKSLRNYQKYRDQELILKITLKKKIDEIKAELENLERHLPKTKYKEEKQDAEAIIREVTLAPQAHQEQKREYSLEQEAAEIKRRLSMLGK